MATSSILLSGLNGAAEAALLERLEDLKLNKMAAPPEPNDGEQLPNLAVVALQHDAEAAFRLVSTLSARGTRVAVIGAAKDPDVILRAMRAGAREFVVEAEPDRLELAVRNLARPPSAGTTGTVISVFPAKGGTGATTVATNLAGSLAATGNRVCLVDLDAQLGDVLSFLDLTATYSIADVLSNMKRLDRDLLEASVPRHRSGVAVLAHGEKLEESERVEPDDVRNLLGFLREHYTHVVVDGVRRFDDAALAALDQSDGVMLVVTQEVPAVRGAQRCVEIFRRLGYPDAKVRLIVNRWHKSSTITREVIAETTGAPVTGIVTNDYATLLRAIHKGALLAEEAPRAAITRDVAALAAGLGAGERSPARGGLIQRLFGQR